MFIFDCAGSLLLYMGFSLVAASRDYSVAVIHGLLIVVASLVGENGLQGVPASVAAAPGLLSTDSTAVGHQLSCHLPRPRIEPVSPALAGGFPTTEPPGKPQRALLHKEGNPKLHKLSPHKIWTCASFQRWADTPQTRIILLHSCLRSAGPGQETISEPCAD